MESQNNDEMYSARSVYDPSIRQMTEADVEDI